MCAVWLAVCGGGMGGETAAAEPEAAEVSGTDCTGSLSLLFIARCSVSDITLTPAVLPPVMLHHALPRNKPVTSPNVSSRGGWQLRSMVTRYTPT